MTEISNYDISVHDQFARATQAAEEFQQIFHIPAAGMQSIAGQAIALQLVPQPSELDRLLRLNDRKLWIEVSLPPEFAMQRAFGSLMAPTLGSQEKLSGDMENIKNFLTERKQEDEQSEGQTILGMLTHVHASNEIVLYIQGRMMQFIQA